MSDSISDPQAADGKIRVFLAFKLTEARVVERLLDEQGFEYDVSVEALGRTLFGSPRNAAIFSVVPHQAAQCVSLLERSGFGAGVIPQEE